MDPVDRATDPASNNLQNQSGCETFGLQNLTPVEGQAASTVAAPNATAASDLAADELMAAVTTISSDTASAHILSNVEHTLDQLTSATDLFDVPAFDLDGTG
jgi:hypothetical protein